MQTWRTSMPAAVIALIAIGCASGSDPQEPDAAAGGVVRAGVAYAADTAIMESFPVQLAVTVTAVNAGTRTAAVTFPDGCLVLLRVYRDAARTQLVWDQGEHVGCTMALVEWRLPPGGSRTARTGASAGDILGTTLPDGHYWFGAVIRPDGQEIALPAGDADLAVAR